MTAKVLIIWPCSLNSVVIITEFNEQGQIINTLVTKNYKVNGNYIEVTPLNSKETYILKGSAEIIPVKN